MEARTLWSVLLAALAFSLLNVGLALEKKGASSLPAIEGAGALRSLKNFLTNPTWLIGFVFTMVQMGFLWAALGLGSMSLVAPMAGVGLVVLAAFSHFYLHEPVSRPMLAGIGLVIGGIAILGATHPGEPSPLGAGEALALALKPSALAVFAAMATLAVVPVVLSVRASWRAADVACGLASGAATALATVAARVMMAGLGTAGDDGGVGAVLLRAQTWPLLVLIVGGNAGSMVVQQFGFQRGRAVVLAPIFTVATVVLPALAGVAVFGEWAGFGAAAVAVQVGALLLVLTGTAVLSAFAVSRPTGSPPREPS